MNISRFGDRLGTYDGELWWLPMNAQIRNEKFDQKAFFDFLFSQAQQRKAYGMPQAVKPALDTRDTMPFALYGPGYNSEDFSIFFCSGPVATGLEIAGAVGTVNASKVTPIDLCRWQSYEGEYYLLKEGPANKIPGSIRLRRTTGMSDRRDQCAHAHES